MADHTECRDGVKCPWCDYVMEDAHEWCAQDTPRRYVCDDCGKPFNGHADYDVTYVTTRA